VLTWCTIAAAFAGSVQAEAAVDVFHSASRSAAALSGPDEVSGTTDVGARLQGELHEADDRLHAEVDYRGRQPVAGLASNRPLHLLTDAYVAYEVLDDRFTVAGGRMLVEAFQWLPIDGLRTTAQLAEGTTLSVFGGRRAISTARRNLGGFLPAVGGSVARVHERYGLSAMASYSEDRFELGTPQGGTSTDLGSFASLVRGHGRPVDTLWVGGQVSLAQRATYVLGAQRADTVVELTATDLHQGIAWVSWRPVELLRLDADVHGQRGAFAFGGDEGAADELLVDPSFFDQRLRATLAHELGAARVDGRLRLRPDRQERRVGAQLDAHRVGLPGLFARGRAFYDDIVDEVHDDDVAGVDRGLWSVSGGYDRNGLSLELGASFIERAAVPVSGRVGNTVGAGALRADDLSPFVLEAQRIAFLRAFWVVRSAFVGVDVERQLGDDEWRAYVQIGTFGERTW
jgi:hypothetical protein